jgi:ATP-dependent RNA circularization protein (DNA/RNA ligase family)
MNPTRIKYPRTKHWPASPGATSDDKVHTSINQWEGREVVVTEKLDGECTTLARNYLHARSLDYTPHPSRTFVKALWGQIAHDIPETFRICGENITAQHSIQYRNLPSYFFVFNIWNEMNCLSWDETVEWSKLLGLYTVPILHRGQWEEGLIDRLVANLDLETQEGLVLRPSSGFTLEEFPLLMAKWVRPNHVTSSSHWAHEQTKFNKLQEE